LEIDRPVLDLDDDVIFEFSVKWMEDVESGSRAVVLGIAPVKVMVVNKRPVKDDAAMSF